MQEKQSFDNCLGVLPYGGGLAVPPGPCDADDHRCVDGLSCARHPRTSAHVCHDANRDEDQRKEVTAFHLQDCCVKTDLDQVCTRAAWKER